jgi:hypothetical protein
MRGPRVAGGVATAVVVLTGAAAVAVDVRFVDVWPDLRPFASQPGSSASAASEAARPRANRRTMRFGSALASRFRVAPGVGCGPSLEATGGEIRPLLNHPVVRVRVVRGPVASG